MRDSGDNRLIMPQPQHIGTLWDVDIKDITPIFHVIND